MQCGQQLTDDSQFCFTCGADASSNSPAQESFCIKCGQSLTEDADFCFSCGANVDVAVEVQPLDIFLQPEPTRPITPPQQTAPRPHQQAPLPPQQAAMRPPQTQAAPHATPTEVPVQTIPVSHIQTTDARPAPRKRRKERGGILFLVGVVIIIAGVVAAFFFMQEEPYDEYVEYDVLSPFTTDRISISYGDSEYILRVANGYLSNHTHMSVGRAFEDAIHDPAWSHFHDDGSNYVSIHGLLYYGGRNVHAQAIFYLLGDGSSFIVTNFFLDSIQLDTASANALVDDIMTRLS